MTESDGIGIVAAILLAADRVAEYTAVSGARTRGDFDYEWRAMTHEAAIEEACELLTAADAATKEPA